MMEQATIFQCAGKVNVNDFHLPRDSLLHRAELPALLNPTPAPTLENVLALFGTARPAATAILHLKHLIKLMEMQMRVLCRFESPANAQRPGVDFYELRRQICDFVVYVRNYFRSIHADWRDLQHAPVTELKAGHDDVLLSIRRFLLRLKYLSPATLHHAASSAGNRCAAPEFHLFHLHLELRWLIVTLLHDRAVPWRDDQADRLDRTMALVVQDLVFVSLKVFETINSPDLRAKSPYPCSCARDLWLALQIVLDATGRGFWSCVNDALNGVIEREARHLSWHSGEKRGYVLDAKNPEMFALWMTYHLALLYGYDHEYVYVGAASPRVRSNADQLERILKSFLNKGGKEGERDEIDEELCAMIPLLKTLILDFWRSRESSINVISFLWECFHRRLDQPFLVQTGGPWSVSLEKKTPRDILRQIRDRVVESVDNTKESSFGMFLRLLGTILKSSYERGDLKLWNQLRGRIYSKFSKSKVQNFSEVRLFNLISLLLTLGVTADASNVCLVTMDLLPDVLDVTAESARRLILSWKGQLCCLLLFAERSLNLEPIAERLTRVVNDLSCQKDEPRRSMMAAFVDALITVLSTSENLDRGEHHLIGGWVDRYLLECSKNRAGAMLKLLLELLNKARDLDLRNSAGRHMLEALWASAAARVRALVYENDLTEENCEDIGKLAAGFTLEALRCPQMAEAQKHSAPSLFRHFTNAIYVRDVKISRIYLATILENREDVATIRSLLESFDLQIMQVWIKCAILGLDSSTGEMKTIKNYVVNLEEVKRVFPSWRDSLDFKSSRESLIRYVNTLVTLRSSASEAERIALDKRTRAVFDKLDRWVLAPIRDENKDSAGSFFIYRCLGTILLTCAPMLHTSANSMLRTFIVKFMLPPEEHAYLKHLGKKIFSMVMLGLENVNVRGDDILQRIIVELFNVYLPLLVTDNDGRSFRVADQLTKFFCEAKRDFLAVVLEKISANFLTFSNGETHKHSYLVMELLRSLLNYGEDSKKFMVDLLVTKCMSNVVECYLRVHEHHPHRRQTVDLVFALCANHWYLQDNDLRESSTATISKPITARIRNAPQPCFELLHELHRADPRIAASIAATVEAIIVDLEVNRQLNAASLRYALKKFQSFCDKIVP